MSDVGSVLWAIAMAVLSIVTVVGNLAVLLSYYLDKNIRHPSNYFIFSLAVSDLVPDRPEAVQYLKCQAVQLYFTPK
ncbi:hypothetical protein Q1695_013963 [Nippostrongylus brasiliensis]|nr:hypothetical protein Q1695_013963 [Nippostrongylus brasiliensis]